MGLLFWFFFEGWVYTVATISVGALQKIAELSTRFQMGSYTYISQMQRLMQKNWLEQKHILKL